jgi:hypothetical protein
MVPGASRTGRAVLFLVGLLAMSFFVLGEEEDEEEKGPPSCKKLISGECHSYAQCTFLANATRCSRCALRSNDLSHWTEWGGDATCVCVTRDKEARPGSWTPITCGSFGGSWYNGECWFITHPGLNATTCGQYGGTWDNGKCYLPSCDWVWL